MRNNLFLGVAVAALAIPAAVSAQQITTGIEGTVQSAEGQPLDGAEVVVTDTRTGVSQNVTTSSGGTFRVVNLVTGGPYTVTATAPGYEGQTISDITTTLQGNTSLQFGLSSGAAETVVVTGTRRANVTQLSNGPGTSFGAAVLETAPSFNRDIRDVIRIDPRVSLDRDDGGSGQDRVSCLGGNDRTNTFTVDGIVQADVYGLNDTPFASRSSIPIPYDGIRETQVNFAPFDVEYGQFTGCAINVVTKSGTNKFHGTGFYEYTGDDLRGDSIAGRPVIGKVSDKRWGATLGGPIIKDKLFFFGAYEQSKATLSQDDGPTGAGFTNQIANVTAANVTEFDRILRTVYGLESGGIATTLPYKNRRFFGRADYYITDQHRLEATYQRLEEATTRPDDFSTTVPQVATFNTFYRSGTTSDYYSGRLYSNWSDKFSTEFSYANSRVIDAQNPVGGGEAQDASPIPRFIVSVQQPSGLRGNIVAGPGTSRSANDLQTRIQQFKGKGVLSAGDHSFKLGAELNRAKIFNLFVQNATGALTFSSLANFEAGLLSLGTGANSANITSGTGNSPTNIGTGVTEAAFAQASATGDINFAAAEFTRSIWSAYLSDDWRVTDKLNATIGGRVDFYSGGRPNANATFLRRYNFSNAVGFGALEPVFMPRVGLNYNFENEGFISRTRVKGGVGIFSGGDPGVWFGNAFQNDGQKIGGATTDGAFTATTGITCPTGQIDVTPGGGAFTGVPACVTQRASTLAARGLANAQSIDPDIKSPTVLRLNAGFETELNFGGNQDGWRVSVDYIYSRYRNPFNVRDLTATPLITAGLNGFAIDGRPIYRAVDPTNAGCAATYVDDRFINVTTPCYSTTRNSEYQLTNSKGFTSQIASVILNKSFNTGLFTDGGSSFFSLGYAFTDSHDRRNMYNSTAGSNYQLTAAFDRQAPDESRGFFASRHNISMTARFTETLFKDLATVFGVTAVARTGRPYSLTFTNSGNFNDGSAGFDNSLLYVPTGITDPNLAPTSNATAVQNLVNYVNQSDCASKYKGRSIARNACTNPTFFDVDLTFSQELPGPASLFGLAEDKIRLYATLDNFLNLLDDDYNVFRRGQFSGLIDVAQTTGTGVDAAGRYIISGFGLNANDAFLVQNSSSLWRLKVGVSYKF
ncbi:MAG: TonB-dependent receptor [Pseudomonadota bacterium]